ncbi:MAG: cytochrome c peroxidase, partial [Planctomycetota bacterium]
SQALGPIENPIEMGSDRLALAHHIAADEALAEAYAALFGELPELSERSRFPAHARPAQAGQDTPLGAAWDAMSKADRDVINRVFANVGKALAAYERLLISRDSAFDRFASELQAEGSSTELSPTAQRGLKLFIGRGQCTTCHAGPELTDREFHNTSAPPLDGGDLRDPGRFKGAETVRASIFNAAGSYSDAPAGSAAQRVQHLRVDSESWGEFKTPTLRSLTGRAPFMHQGQFADIDAVLHFYSTLEGAAGRNHHAEQVLIPLRLTEAESTDLAAFLQSLTGEPLPSSLLTAPPAPRLAGSETSGSRQTDR